MSILVPAVPQLRIAEIFSSIQGEGLRIGIPSVFVRVSGCNLRCVWCDTPYASWNPEGPILELSEIKSQIEAFGIQDVVITGGEPMLFDAIEPLISHLATQNHFITVETAGTIFRPNLPIGLMSISPKLKNSIPYEDSNWASRHEKIRSNLEPLRQLVANYNHQLKFVVRPENPNEVQEIEEILLAIGTVAKDQIFLMPEGRDSETLHRRGRELIPICVEKGWRLAPRYQIDLFGDTKGT